MNVHIAIACYFWEMLNQTKYLLHFHQCFRHVLVPHVLTVDACPLHRQVAEHYALQDGGVRRDTDASTYQHGMFRVEYVAGRGTERTVNVDLK